MKEKLIKGVSIGLCIGVALGVGAWQLADNWDKIFPDKNIEQENPAPTPSPDESLIVQAKFKVNGVTIATRTVATGGLLEDLPEAPEKDGYKFVGWRVLGTDEEAIDFTIYQFTDNMAFEAIFELLNVARCLINETEYVDIVDPTNEKLASANLPTEIDGREVLGWGVSGSNGQSFYFTEDSEIIGLVCLYPIFACDFEVDGDWLIRYTGSETELLLTCESAIEQGGQTYMPFFSISDTAFSGTSVNKLIFPEALSLYMISYRTLENSNIKTLVFERSGEVYLDFVQMGAEDEMVDLGISLYVNETLLDYYKDHPSWSVLTGGRIYAIEEA